MNNWRLLLLAVVAVFQPIASFTDSNLIDGRQQCCDRVSSAPFQDTRSSLHGTSRFGKTTSALRLNERDETREDRRYELRQRESLFSRPTTERSLVDFRAKVATQGRSEIARSSRIEHRLKRPTITSSREHLLDGNQREGNPRSIRVLKHQDLTRKVVARSSRDALERRNDRVSTESPRNRLFRNDDRSGNGRLSNSFDSQRKMQRDWSVERRITLNRDARRVLSRIQDEVSVEYSNNMNNRQRIARERMSAVRRESSIGPDTRRYREHTDERRDMQRRNEQRQSLSEKTRLVNRIRDMPDRVDTREDTINQRLSSDKSDNSPEQRKERRESRQQNKENIDLTATGERRMQVAGIITRESRIMNIMNYQNERTVDGEREIRHERISRQRKIHDKVLENLDHRISHERILMERKNIRESIIMNTRNKREVDGRLEIRDNKRITRETLDENRENPEQRLSRERIQMDRRDIRESRLNNVRNTRDVADRRQIRDNERVTRETWDENRENPEQRLSRKRVRMDQRDIRESRLNNVRNTRDVADRREIQDKGRMNRENRDENRENPEHRLSRERIQMDRRDIRESRLNNVRNTRDVADRREIRDNEKVTKQSRDENREDSERRHYRDKIQMERRDIRETRLINGRNMRDVADRREIRDDKRVTWETRNENRANSEQRLSRERIQMDRRDIRESRHARNTRNLADRREIRDNERMSRVSRDENRENPEQRLNREKYQMNRRDIRESRNILTDRNIDDRREVRDTERNTRDKTENYIRRSQVDRKNIREFHVSNNVASRDDDRRIDSNRESRLNNRMSRDENRKNREERLARERIQMDRRNVREFRNMKIIIRTTRDVEGQRQIRTETKLHTENTDNPDHRLARIVMDRRNTRDSRRDLNSRQEIRESRESRKQMRENPDRRLARESRQVDRRNTVESWINRVATRNERSVDTESPREIRYIDMLSENIRELRVESRYADRENDERHSSMMDRRVSSAVRRNFREVRAEPKLSRSADSERSEVFRSRVEHTHNIENRERQAVYDRSQNVQIVRESNSVMVEKLVSVGDFTVANWQYILYTLQAAYLCTLLTQMLKPSRNEKTHMSLRWLPVSSRYNPIKVD